MVSNTLGIYKRWLETATPEQVALVDSIYAACEAHYEQGGHWVCECFEPEDVLKHFPSVEAAKDHCNIMVDRERDTRWGEDSDPQAKLESWK